MPIVISNVEQSAQEDGGSNVTVRLYDQDGREYMTSFRAPAGFDIQSKVNIMIAEQNEQLAQLEFEALVGL